jgi:hypothetical protein
MRQYIWRGESNQDILKHICEYHSESPSPVHLLYANKINSYQKLEVGTCNPTHSGGRGKRNMSSRPARLCWGDLISKTNTQPTNQKDRGYGSRGCPGFSCHYSKIKTKE